MSSLLPKIEDKAIGPLGSPLEDIIIISFNSLFSSLELSSLLSSLSLGQGSLLEVNL